MIIPSDLPALQLEQPQRMQPIRVFILDCPICLMDVNVPADMTSVENPRVHIGLHRNIVVLSPCGHLYHDSCLRLALAALEASPLICARCRRPVNVALLPDALLAPLFDQAREVVARLSLPRPVRATDYLSARISMLGAHLSLSVHYLGRSVFNIARILPTGIQTADAISRVASIPGQRLGQYRIMRRAVGATAALLELSRGVARIAFSPLRRCGRR